MCQIFMECFGGVYVLERLTMSEYEMMMTRIQKMNETKVLIIQKKLMLMLYPFVALIFA